MSACLHIHICSCCVVAATSWCVYANVRNAATCLTTERNVCKKIIWSEVNVKWNKCTAKCITWQVHRNRMGWYFILPEHCTIWWNQTFFLVIFGWLYGIARTVYNVMFLGCGSCGKDIHESPMLNDKRFHSVFFTCYSKCSLENSVSGWRHHHIQFGLCHSCLPFGSCNCLPA